MGVMKRLATSGKSHKRQTGGGAKSKASMQVLGIPEIDKQLKKLGPQISKKIIRKGMRPAQKIIRDQAKMYCPVDYGDLEDSIKVTAGKRTRKSINIHVSTSGSDNIFTGDTYYAGFVEWGCPDRPEYPAQPFLRPAFDSKKDEAKAFAEKRILELAEEELSKASKAKPKLKQLMLF